jgi:hypothetical protein
VTYRARLRIWETNYGRVNGWDLELDGRPIAIMDEPRSEDMFWDSYRVTPTTDDPTLAARLLTQEFWKSEDFARIVFRNRVTGLVAEYAFPSMGPLVAPARVNMRALYLNIGHPLPCGNKWGRL